MSALNISTSGLLASSALLADGARAAAGIPIGAGASGAAASGGSPADIVDIGGGGVRSATAAYGARGSTAGGFAANFDPVRSTLDQITASATYRADIAAIRTGETMQRSLLATLA